jgi:predicted metalloprotease
VTANREIVLHAPVSRRPQRSPTGAFLLLGLAAFAVSALVVALVFGPRQPAETTLSARPGDLGGAERATITSLTDYWRREMPRTYDHAFSDLRGGYQPKVPSSKPWRCNGKSVSYRDIRGNAFYCGGTSDDYVAYDAALLFPRLNMAFGSVAPAIVLAHETGHAIQHRAAVVAPSIVVELQADCFAGSWSGFALRSGDDPVQLAPTALDSSVGVMLTLRDQVGTPATRPQAHGLGFDRVNAFQTGYESGARSCARFPSKGVPTTELPFSTPLEAQTRGNMSYATAVPLFVRSLDSFWAGAATQIKPGADFTSPRSVALPQPPLPPCPGTRAGTARLVVEYCRADNRVSWIDPLLESIHNRSGDMATGAVLSDAWGQAGQSQLGLPVTGREAGLQRDCITGAWVSAIASGAQPQLSLSPGDVDEVLGVIVAGNVQTSDRGGVFERTHALRAGVLEGLAACT